MSILNVTPDSFSDGGSYSSVPQAVQAALSHAEAGADIIDIGGVSTRPGSAHVTEEEEISRVIPVIEGIRKAGLQIPISVDTYRASIAERSIAAGANIINDISGGLFDPAMLETVARLDVPFVLMHMRGAPEEVNLAKHQKYEGDNVVGGVRRELADAVRLALEKGIKRWNIILDPGVGFSKDQKGNLDLLRDLPAVTGRKSSSSLLLPAAQHLSSSPPTNSDNDQDSYFLSQFPVLLGVSRKGFIGKITGRTDPKEREHGNSAIHALAVANGVNIIRVHDVEKAKDAVTMADAIYGRV